MLLLTAGFGHDSYQKVWLSLHSTGSLKTFDEVADAMIGFGCHPEFMTKIYTCLSMSGRYDCCVQYGWINDSDTQAKLLEDLLHVGVECRFDRNYNPPKGYR